MKKDLIFVPILLVISILLFLFKATRLPGHIIISILGVITLVIYTITTKKCWKIPVLEILMRVFYCIALIFGVIIMSVNGIIVLNIIHKIAAVLFVVLLVVTFLQKLIVKGGKK